MHSFSLLKNGPNRYTIRSKIQPDAGSPLDANQPIQNRCLSLLLLLLPLPVLRIALLLLLVIVRIIVSIIINLSRTVTSTRTLLIPH